MGAEIMQLAVPDPLDDVVRSYLGGPAPELPPASTRDEALVRAASIREGVERFARETVPQIGQAYLCRDWEALGYPSWEFYVRGEFGLDRLRLPRGDRQSAVGTLRLFGMSTRSIGQALGVDQKTVVNDLRTAGPAGDGSPPAEVVGADGKRYAAARPAVAEPDPVPAAPTGAPAPESAPEPPAVPSPAPEPAPTPASPAPVDEGTELVAGPVRIRVRAQRRDGNPVVLVRLTHERTIGEEWTAADSNDDPLQVGVALDEHDLDDLINTLIDAKARLRRMRGAS